VVIDAGHGTERGAVGEIDAPDHVHLPELHRARAFPALVVRALAATRLGLDEPLADQGSIDPRTRRHLVELVAQLGQDGPRSPERVGPAHGDDPGLDHRGQLVWTAVGLRALLGQSADPLVGIADQPTVQRPAVDPMAGGHIGDRRPGVEHLSDSEIALLKHRKLPQCHDRLLGSEATQPRSKGSPGQWTE
jgi:hypothetical protein